MRRLTNAISIIAVVIVTICPLAVSAQSSALAEATESPLIQQGTVELSTLGSFMGSNILGLGASFLTSEGDSVGTLGLSIGYFAQSFAEFEGSFGVMRLWDSDSSMTSVIGIGKFVLNYVTQKTTAVPYAFGGGGLIYTGYGNSWYSESETDKLVTFGGGVKVPLVIIRQIALRAEYSYTKNLDEETEPVHAVSIGFSMFF